MGRTLIKLGGKSGGHVIGSRALVWLRMNRLEDSLSDLDAVLLQNPALGPNHFLRALVLKRLGRGADAIHELAIARRLAPETESDYARFGLTF